MLVTGSDTCFSFILTNKGKDIIMKKIALSSLIAVFAVSSAHAANVIDGNPLYMPKANHFYSVTDVNSHTRNNTPWNLGEEFGYGITDRWSVALNTTLSENDNFDQIGWNTLTVGTALRAVDMGGWKLDVLGAYGFDALYRHPVAAGEDAWFDKDATDYTWTAGVRGGYATSRFTVAAKALFEYSNEASFKWNAANDHEGRHDLVLGLDGQFVLCDKLNLVAGVEYNAWMDEEYRGYTTKNEGTWEGTFGVNYNIDATKFVGAYVNASMNHQGGAAADEWKTDKGIGFGAKFGIDF